MVRTIFSNIALTRYQSAEVERDAVEKPNRVQIALWSLMLVVSLALSVRNFQAYQVGTYYDDACYIILSQSLLYSENYGMINTPGEPAAGRFPFVYPLFLTPFIRLFPDNLDALKIPSLLATGLITTLLFWGWRWFSKSKSYWWALMIAGLYSLAPLTIDHSRRIISEPVFTLFCLAAIILSEQAVRRKSGFWWTTLMSVCLVLVVYSRSIGIVLVGSVFLYLLIKNGIGFWKQLFLVVIQMGMLVGLVVLITPVQPRDILPVEYMNDENSAVLRIFVKAFGITPAAVDAPSTGESEPQPSGENPGNQTLSKFLPVIKWGIREHFGKHIRMVALPVGGGQREQDFADWLGVPALPRVLGFLITGLVLFGILRLFLQEGLTLFPLFAILYFVAIFFWWWDDPRLLYPIQFQLHLGLILGLDWLFSLVFRLFRPTPISGYLRTITLGSLFCLLMAITVYKSSQIEDSRLHAGDIEARTKWIAANASAASILMTEEPEIDYLYSKTKTISTPYGITSSSQLEEYLTRWNIGYILVAPRIGWQPVHQPEYSLEMRDLLPILQQLSSENRITQMYSQDEEKIKVFKVQP